MLEAGSVSFTQMSENSVIFLRGMEKKEKRKVAVSGKRGSTWASAQSSSLKRQKGQMFP